MEILQISKINRQPSRRMYMVKGKQPRNNSFDAGDKHFKICFSQTSYEHKQDNIQRHHLTNIVHLLKTFLVTHSA